MSPEADQPGPSQTVLLVLGGAVGMALSLLCLPLSFGATDAGQGALDIALVMIMLAAPMLILAALLLHLERVRSFAKGLLISVAIGVLVSGVWLVAAAYPTG